MMPGINLLPVGIWDCWLPTHPQRPGSQSSSCWQRWAMAPVTRAGQGTRLSACPGAGLGFWHARDKERGWRAGLGWFMGLGGLGLDRKGRRHKITSRANPKHGCPHIPSGKRPYRGQREEPAAMPGYFSPAKHTDQAIPPQAIPPQPSRTAAGRTCAGKAVSSIQPPECCGAARYPLLCRAQLPRAAFLPHPLPLQPWLTFISWASSTFLPSQAQLRLVK